MYGVFRYAGTQNLGDAIQTVALSRLLPGRLRGVSRRDSEGRSCTCFVANGWLGDNALPLPGVLEPTVFGGVFLAGNHNLEWLRRSPFPIGTRDPATHSTVLHAGLNAEMIGCASLTLPRYRGRRSGTYVIDSQQSSRYLPRTAERMTHHIPYELNWQKQWQRAIEVLDVFRSAVLVYTSRLHVALPCIAFGTPVVFSCPDSGRINDPLVHRRVSLLRCLGVIDGIVAEIDAETFANRYRRFLHHYLGIEIQEHLPRFPN